MIRKQEASLKKKSKNCIQYLTETDKNMQIELNCPQCSLEYQDSNPPRLLQCGHTFCQVCLNSMVCKSQDSNTLTCPQDQQIITLSSDVSKLPKNIALMKLIDARKKNSSNNSSTSMKDASFDVSKINKEQQCQEDDFAEELISQINRGSLRKEDDLLKNTSENTAQTTVHIKNQSSTSKQHKNKQIECCLLHQKPIQVVCMNDFERLCSKCALFGQHKGHQFKSLEEIQKANDKYYHQIVEMFDRKASFSQKKLRKQAENGFLEVLNVKTSSLQRQIKQKFKDIRQEILKIEKSCLEQLEMAHRKIADQLSKGLQMDKSLSSQYDRWEQAALKDINEKEKATSEGHLNFYLKGNDLVMEGRDLIQLMKKKQQTTFSLIEQVIQNLSVSFNSQGLMSLLKKVVSINQHSISQAKKEDPKLKQNEATLANCNFLEIQKLPQLTRQQSEQSLLDACQFETHSFIGQPIGSKMLDSSFVSVRNQYNSSHNSSNQKQHMNRPVIKKKTAVALLKEREKVVSKQLPTNQGSVLNSQNVKKKMRTLKVSEKYEKVIEGVINDSLQIVDLTNAELGDNTVLQILDLMKDSKRVKTLKLIRNKLTDEGVTKMIPYFSHLISLNLSQNQLTENTLGVFIDSKPNMPLLKSLILSQTKIVQRKSKGLIQRLKKMEMTVSV